MYDVRREGELWPKTLWLREEDEERLKNIAEGICCTESEAVIFALRFYEDALEAFRNGASEWFHSGKAWEVSE
jgi:hypothetical protein